FSRNIMRSRRRSRRSRNIDCKRRRQVVPIQMAVVVIHRPVYVVHDPVSPIPVSAAVLDFKVTPAAAASSSISIEPVPHVIHIGIGVVEMYVRRCARWLHIEAQWKWNWMQQ